MLPKDVHTDLSQTESQGFNNKGHIGHFFNYLFRTDKNQKWTNDKTEENLILVYSGKRKTYVPISFPSDLDERVRLKELFKKRTFAVLPNQSHTDLLNDIVYMDIRSKSTGQNVEHMAIVSIEILEIAKEAIKLKDPCQTKDVFHVVHVDQSDALYHIHSLGV